MAGNHIQLISFRNCSERQLSAHHYGAITLLNTNTQQTAQTVANTPNTAPKTATVANNPQCQAALLVRPCDGVLPSFHKALGSNSGF